VKTARASSTRPFPAWLALFATTAFLLCASESARAEVTPAAGYTPPDDTPSIKIGAVIFSDYTYQSKPTAKDSAGNDIKSNSFNVSRSYINITGNISHMVAFRITPDVTRETGTGSSLNGSLTFRIKYAFAQINLDDWMPKGSWIRVGIQQTPYIDFIEGIYRYRFQGTMFQEREGPGGSGSFMSSSDAGVSFHTAFPNNYGDLHVGVYNGEFYSKAEANDQKAFQIRASFRPLPQHPILRGWRVTGMYIADNYMANAERKRAIVNTTFEHPYINIGVDYLDTKDKASSALTAQGLDLNPDLHGKGWTVWATPKKVNANGSSIEGLIRYEQMKPGGAVSGTNIVSPDGVDKRSIVGVAYWFPKQGSVSAALLFDVETVTFDSWVPARPTQQKVCLHTLISF